MSSKEEGESPNTLRERKRVQQSRVQERASDAAPEKRKKNHPAKVLDADPGGYCRGLARSIDRSIDGLEGNNEDLTRTGS